MKRILLVLPLCLVLFLSGCGTPEENSTDTTKENQQNEEAIKADLQDTLESMAISYTRPEDVTDEEWAVESVQKAKQNLAKSPNTDPEFLTLLAEDESKNVVVLVAKNPSTPLEVLKDFATSDDQTIRNYLAANTQLPLEILDILSKDESANVRQAAAFNISNSIENLSLLAADKVNEVQNHVARNPQLPEEVMLVMVEKSSPGALQLLLARDQQDLSEAVLEALKNHKNEKIREAAEAYSAE